MKILIQLTQKRVCGLIIRYPTCGTDVPCMHQDFTERFSAEKTDDRLNSQLTSNDAPREAVVRPSPATTKRAFRFPARRPARTNFQGPYRGLEPHFHSMCTTNSFFNRQGEGKKGNARANAKSRSKSEKRGKEVVGAVSFSFLFEGEG